MAKKIIPRKIHYVWLGKSDKPPLIKRCIESWKQHNPSWEIIEWNEDNFPFDEYPFAKEALERKRYAFATDIIRLWAIYNHGGIYCDSDVFCVRPLDKFLEHKAFTGHETKDLMVTAVMGAIKGHEWIKMLLDYYDGKPYSENTNTNIITELSRKLIERENNYGFRYLKGDVVIYPIHTFCNFNHQQLEIIPSSDAYAYHLFAGSWVNRESVSWNFNGRGLDKLNI